MRFFVPDISRQPARVVKPSLRAMSKSAILQALARGGEDNLVLRELSALVISYIWTFSQLPEAEQRLDNPCAIEEVALLMAKDALENEHQAQSQPEEGAAA